MSSRFGTSDSDITDHEFSPELLHSRLVQVRESVARACLSCARDPNSVTLVGVSKTKPLEAIEAAARFGLQDFGENYIQEAKLKAEHFPDLKWHLIGHIQKNKVHTAAQIATVIHSLDSAELIRRLERSCAEQGRVVSGLIQVRLGHELTKSGVDPEDLFSLLDELRAADLHYLRLVGLMTIPPPAPSSEGNRPHFRRLRQLLEEIVARRYPFWSGQELSMGMSGDYQVAIEEGATYVRVGRAIFGDRNYKKLRTGVECV